MTRRQLLAAGLCRNYYRCGHARGEQGTSLECRPCAAARNQVNATSLKDKRHEWDASGKCIGCGGRRNNHTKRCNDCRDLMAINDGNRKRTAEPRRAA